jgi:hypothetical protein
MSSWANRDVKFSTTTRAIKQFYADQTLIKEGHIYVKRILTDLTDDSSPRNRSTVLLST